MKTALVTGANKGIGREVARQLGKMGGVHVLVGVRNLEEGEEVVQELRDMGSKADLLPLDVSDPGSIKEAAGQISDKFDRLDILINNAAIKLDHDETPGSNASTISREELEQTMITNFYSVVDLTQRLLPLVKASPQGRIVLTTSNLASLTLHSDPNWEYYHFKTLAYNVSKTAINVFMIHLAYELKDTTVKVNACHPGHVKTEMGGEDAKLSLEEGAETTVWLATLPDDGPHGGYFHKKDIIPW